MSSTTLSPPEAASAAPPTFRSAAVARLAQMPVATLRIWEQRYRAVHPATAASGHRLYSAADVQRVLLLRQLTERGHAIGSIAALDMTALRHLAEMASGRSTAPATGAPPLRLAVAGPALALRLQRAAPARPAGRVPRVVSVFETLAEAARAGGGLRADLLVWHAPELRPGVPAELRAAQLDCGAARAAVVYRFAAAATVSALEDAGVAALREPADDATLGHWLLALAAELPRPGQPPAAPRRDAPVPAAPAALAPRRYDDAALTTIAGLGHRMACECPRHVAELLMQIASFEAYSAGCLSRNPADAELHAELHRLAGSARMLFETALERVAQHEGLVLP